MADYRVVDKDQLDAGLTIIADAIREKGGTTADLEFPNEMRSAVLSIETGADTTVDHPAEEEDIVEGKEAWVDGVKITGINPYKLTETDNEVSTQEDLMQQIMTSLAEKGSYNIDTSDATIDATEVVQGEIGYGRDGERIVGTNPYKKTETNNEVQFQKELIEQIQSALENKTGGGSGTNTNDANAVEEDISIDKIAYVKGKRITGTNPYIKSETDAEVLAQKTLIERIQTALADRITESSEKSGENEWIDGAVYAYEPIVGEYVENSDGTFVPYSSWSRTPYLYCEGASALRVKSNSTSAMITDGDNGDYNVFFDKDKKYIKGFDYNSLDTHIIGAYVDVIIPENASYFIVSGHDAVLGCGDYSHEAYVKFIPIG